MPKRPNSNTELVREMMEFSKFGPLAQMFIVDALTKHVDRIAETPVAELKAKWPENDFMPSAEQWHAVACDLKRQMDTFYGRNQWIEWTARGRCPVDGEEIVTVKFEDGRESQECARLLNWSDNVLDGCRIVSYRISR